MLQSHASRDEAGRARNIFQSCQRNRSGSNVKVQSLWRQTLGRIKQKKEAAPYSWEPLPKGSRKQLSGSTATSKRSNPGFGGEECKLKVLVQSSEEVVATSNDIPYFGIATWLGITAAVLAIFQFGENGKEIELSGGALAIFPYLHALRHILTALLAGGIGAAVVYPIDLVKTRLQNQDYTCDPYYDNIIDCSKKIVAAEGAVGLYAGALPQILGVAPQKGLKMTVFNSVYPILVATPLAAYGWLPPVWVAGVLAAIAQAAITNPLEMTKIRLQLQNMEEPDLKKRTTAVDLCRELGWKGLYKGSSLTLARDIPSVSLFWVGYEAMKRYFGADEAHDLTAMEYLIAGLVSGAPAAFLATPMDVVKTRFQAKEGALKYESPMECLTTIVQREGWRVLWSGGLSRVLRISPQLGVTLAVYEILEPHTH